MNITLWRICRKPNKKVQIHAIIYLKVNSLSSQIDFFWGILVRPDIFSICSSYGVITTILLHSDK